MSENLKKKVKLTDDRRFSSDVEQEPVNNNSQTQYGLVPTFSSKPSVDTTYRPSSPGPDL